MDHSEQIADGAVLLTVNQRLARHHLMRYQSWQLRQGNDWWETPAVLPLRAWLKSVHAQALNMGLSQLTLLPDLLVHKAWRQCIEQDTALHLLDVEAAARSARQAWELSCAWHCYNHEDQYLSLDQFTWQRWRERYVQYLDSQSRIDEASLADHLVELISNNNVTGLLPASIIVDGFLQLPPQLQGLVDSMIATGVNVQQVQRDADAVVHQIHYPDDAQELLGIATQMRQALETQPQQSLGLVVPELQAQRSAVLRAFDRVFFPACSPDEIRRLGRPYDVSLGAPLSDTAVVRTGLLLLRLCVVGIQGSEISAVLLSPYIVAAATEARQREQLDRTLREQRVVKLDLASLPGKLYSNSRLTPAVSKLLRKRTLSAANLSVWAERFSDWLKQLGWPGDSVDTEEYQAVSSWMDCLDDLQLLDEGETFTSSEALTIVQRLARERVFQLDTPHTPIQIMGRLESHAIAFDCLWVAGLDAEQWPPAASPSPYLSIASQKLQGVPGASASSQLSLAESEFQMWCSRSPLVMASRAVLRDGKALEAAAIPTVLASSDNQNRAEQVLRNLKNINRPIDPVAMITAALTLEQLADYYAPPLPAGSAVKGGARLFENQALCPFRAFALHRLRIKPLEEAGIGLDPRQHGTLLHSALEIFWRSLGTHAAMMALSSDAFNQQVDLAVESAMEKDQVPEVLATLEKKRLIALLKEWLEQCEVPRQAFEVVSVEQKLEIEHGGIVMTVVLDRMDRVDNALVVVDYKTGTANKVSTWADQRIVNPQLPLYVLTNEDIEGVSFAQVARNQCGFKGIASDDSLLPKVKSTVTRSRSAHATDKPLEHWSDWRAHWRSALDDIAVEVRQGLASVTPMPTACNYCELKSLCRIGSDAPGLDIGEDAGELDVPAMDTMSLGELP